MPGAPARNAPQQVARASMQRRHAGMVLGFILMVLAPLAGAVYYLYEIADDQYASYVGFAVRSEDTSSAQSLLEGIGGAIGGTSSSDTDILYEFIHSQTMVEAVDARLDLPTIYSKPEQDPVFAYDTDGVIEDLVDYWKRMVRISYAAGSGLIELRVNAFDPQDAQNIALAIVDESTDMINELSAIARSDATRYAREDLEQSVERLKTARETLTRFRSETQIVDPSADIQGQMGLLNELEAQLATASIDLSLLLQDFGEDDRRVKDARRKIQAITDLIEEERQKFGLGGSARTDGDRDYAQLVGEFERILVDVEYAEKSYLSSQAALDVAQAEAQRQSRYLATYTKPSLPQSPRYPERLLLSLVVAVVLLLIWSICVLIYYSLRDRR